MDFEELRQSLISAQQLYTDKDFPADNSSIYQNGESGEEYTWMRPKEICDGEEPKFILDGASRFDIIQGDLGNCWVTVACTCITQNPTIFNKVVPSDQSFDPDSYCGAFYFRFWRYGEWKTVIVDDRLPTKDGKLVFAHSSSENEFWAALVEKAYAKEHKYYKALESGNVADGLTDFTGGVIELYDLQSTDDELPDILDLLTQSFEKNSFAIASVNRPSMPKTKLPNGLVTNHAYNVTDIKKIPFGDEEITLVRIRNPWGNEVEWTGNWSDSSANWDDVSEDFKASLEFQLQNDGEFWMEYSEFRKNFHSLQICHQVYSDETDSSKAWSQLIMGREWVAGESAGGDDSQAELFGTNPQICLEFNESDEDVIIEVMQKNRRERGMPNLAIGFKLYRKPLDMPEPLEGEYLLNTKSETGTFRQAGQLWRTRSVLDRFRDIRATCILVVYTEEPGVEGSVLIRILSTKAN